jgi:hypothetical protein
MPEFGPYRRLAMGPDEPFSRCVLDLRHGDRGLWSIVRRIRSPDGFRRQAGAMSRMGRLSAVRRLKAGGDCVSSHDSREPLWVAAVGDVGLDAGLDGKSDGGEL